MAEGTALSLTPGSAVGRLGEDAAAAEAAAAAAAVSRDPAAPADPAKPADPAAPAVDPAKPAELTPEQKAQAVADAEKALAEAKTDEEKAAAQAKLDELKGEKKAAGAPEKYEDFTLPDGVEIDKAALDEFLPVAKELNLSQEQAQKLIDLRVKQVQAQAEKHVADWNKLLETRLSEAKADKEIGGSNFEQSVADARVFLKQFGTPALQEYLNGAEAGSHVELIRAFAKAGRALADDKFVPANGSSGSGEPKSLADRLFPNHKP